MRHARHRCGQSGTYRSRVIGSCLIALVLAASAGAKTIEEVEKELTEKHDKVKSYTAQTHSEMKMDLGQGNKMTSDSKSTMEWARRGPKQLYRMESKTETETQFGDQKSKTKTTNTLICDSEFLYSLSETDGQKSAVKMKLDPAQSYDVKTMFKLWREEYDLKLLEDEEVDKKGCYVIEATPKPEDPDKKDEADKHTVAKPPSPYSKQTFWLRKDLGMVVKMVALDKAGKPIMTSTMTDIKLDADIKPERFKFELPEGVQLIDMTKLQTDTEPAPADSTPPPAEETGTSSTEQQAPPAKEEKKDNSSGLKSLLKKF